MKWSVFALPVLGSAELTVFPKSTHPAADGPVSLETGLLKGLEQERVMSANGQAAMLEKQRYWDSMKSTWKANRMPSVLNTPQVCPDGGGFIDINDDQYPCLNIDFDSFISLDDLFIPAQTEFQTGTSQSTDIWGWLSPEGREITIHCVDNGVWFIDGTDPVNPLILGSLPTQRSQFSWTDVKVYKNVAYIVKDASIEREPEYGVQVFDLTRLVGLDAASLPVTFEPDFVYAEHGASHNVNIDNDSGFLYSVGTRTCAGGLHMINLEPNPLEPTFAGCAFEDGYTHDVQCVVYDGPDRRFAGEEICFAFNEDTLTIWEVTDKSNPQVLSKLGYEGAGYTHQGWLTADFAYVYFDDELDERNLPEVNTTLTFVADVSNLREPFMVGAFDHGTISIDHNLYVWGSVHQKGWGGNGPLPADVAPSAKYAYLSNYVSGLRVLDVEDPTTPVQAGFFDVSPQLEGYIFEGTWSNYMHPSGVIAVSVIEQGLMFLSPQMAFDYPADGGDETTFPTFSPVLPSTFPTMSPTTAAPTWSEEECYDRDPTGLFFSAGPAASCDLVVPQFCTDSRIQQLCPVGCGFCESECLDTIPSGLQLENGNYEACGNLTVSCDIPIVAERCQRSCGTCGLYDPVLPGYAQPEIVTVGGPTASPTATSPPVIDITPAPTGTGVSLPDDLDDGLAIVGLLGVISLLLLVIAFTLCCSLQKKPAAGEDVKHVNANQL